MNEVLHISHDELYKPEVDATIARTKALIQHAQPIVEESVSPLRRVLLSHLFFTPLAGLVGGLTTWLILEPWLDDMSDSDGAFALLFPLTATLVVLCIFIADGIASRRLRGNVGRWFAGTGFTLLFSILALIPMGIIFQLMVLLPSPPNEFEVMDITRWSAAFFIGFVILRSTCWAIFGGALGLGMNLIRSPRAQRRASLMGGTVGGVLGGVLFDPINRFLLPAAEQGDVMRLVGLCAIGLCVGLFVALSERLGREGWLRVRTGPLRGKAFILYHNPTIIGAAPSSTIYLFKDPKIAPEHAALHRVGNGYEIQTQNDASVEINGLQVHRRRLVSGDLITIGDTILEFEERAKKRSIQLDQKVREQPPGAAAVS